MWLLFISLPLFVVDQLTKWWIVDSYAQGELGISVVPGFFHIVRVHNTGAAWGMFNGTAHSNIALSVVSGLALVLLLVLWWKKAFTTIIGKLAAALLMAGILGNLADRIARQYVVDFLDFQFGDYHFPTFNVADSCITVAAAFFLISAFLPEPKKACS